MSPFPPLRAALAGTPPEQGKEAGPAASELAERIKALRAQNAVEAMPQRTPRRQVSAEQPVTARIRRRAEAGQADDGEWQRRLAEKPAPCRVTEPG